MAKDNKDAVSDYHKQIKDMKIRFPKQNDDLGIPDYSEIIKQQAKLTGKKSVNDYVLSLIEADIRSNPVGLNDSDFVIQKDLREIKLKNS